MKKIFLGTTALVAVSTLTLPAQAAEWEVSVGGYYNAGLGFADVDSNVGTDENEFNFGSDSEIHVNGRLTADNGLTFGARVEFDLESDPDVSSDGFIDESFIFVRGSFGRIVIGEHSGAGYRSTDGIIPGVAGYSVNNNDENNMDIFAPYDVDTGLKFTGLRNRITTQSDFTEDHIKLSYFTPRFAGFQLGVSYTPNPCNNDTGYADCVDGIYEFGRNAIEAGIDFRHTWDEFSIRVSGSYLTAEGGDSRNDPQEWTIGAQVDYGNFTLGAQYADHDTRFEDPLTDRRDDRNEDWAISAQYQVGPLELTGQYGESDQGYRDYDFGYGGWYNHSWGNTSVLGGVKYNIGPGIDVGFVGQYYEYTNDTNGPSIHNNFSTDAIGGAGFLSLSF